MNLQENTNYDISKLTEEQKILLYTKLYYLRPKYITSKLENYIDAAKNEPYKSLGVNKDFSWSAVQHEIKDSVCATTLFLKFPRVVQVRDSEQEQWEERVAIFIDHKGRPYTYQAIREIEEIPEEVEDMMISWKYYREVPQKITLTKQEIANKFNLTVEEIEIV